MFVIILHTKNHVLCRTINNQWCFFFPGMNDQMFKCFEHEDDAKDEIKNINFHNDHMTVQRI